MLSIKQQQEDWCEEIDTYGWAEDLREYGKGKALGVAPTERPKLRRQVAAAGKYSVSLSLFLGSESTGGGRGDIDDGNPFLA